MANLNSESFQSDLSSVLTTSYHSITVDQYVTGLHLLENYQTPITQNLPAFHTYFLARLIEAHY